MSLARLVAMLASKLSPDKCVIFNYQILQQYGYTNHKLIAYSFTNY